jgi:hypothetical protein
LLIFSIKIIKIFVKKEEDSNLVKKNILAKKIDFDSSLILSILILAIVSFVGLVFFSYITQFLSFYEPIKG